MLNRDLRGSAPVPGAAMGNTGRVGTVQGAIGYRSRLRSPSSPGIAELERTTALLWAIIPLPQIRAHSRQFASLRISFRNPFSHDPVSIMQAFSHNPPKKIFHGTLDTLF